MTRIGLLLDHKRVVTYLQKELSQASKPVNQYTDIIKTRLHQFARSLLYNATAGGALWWFRKSHIVNYAKHEHSPFARRRHDFSNYIPPIVWWKFHENPFSRSRERLSHSFGGRKKNKKNKRKHLQNIYASASYRKAVAQINTSLRSRTWCTRLSIGYCRPALDAVNNQHCAGDIWRIDI